MPVNPFGPSTSTPMDAKRDERGARTILYFERYSSVILGILMYGEVDKISYQDIFYKLAPYFVLKRIIFNVKKLPW